MVCIYCGGKTQVTNSRPQKRLLQVWRRRACTVCGAVFTTNELVDLGGSLAVRSKNGHLHPFSRDKLFASVLRACGHRKDAVGAAGALTATVIAKLRAHTNAASVQPQDIAAMTYETLAHFDTAASVQYQAYHPEHV